MLEQALELLKKSNEQLEDMRRIAISLKSSRIDDEGTYWLWGGMVFTDEDSLNRYLMEEYPPVGLLDDDFSDYIHDGVLEAKELSGEEVKKELIKNIELKLMF
jgi:hypothetical protein